MIKMNTKNTDFDFKRLNEHKQVIDRFLINSYSNPFIKEPFCQEIDIYLEFMNSVCEYLCTFVDKTAKTPLISVIMPVFNQIDTVMNAINSVLSQTYDNFELIIVDDASTDGTKELLSKLKHEKIHVFFHEENKDCCGVRNTGLKNAKGYYITYLDSDNLMDKNFLKANLGAFLRLPDADCVYSAQSRHETYDSPFHTILFGSLNKSGLLNRNFVDANTIFHKKEILDKVNGFDETLHREEDWDFILKISNHFKIYGLPFLQSRYHTGLSDNRMSETRKSNHHKIHKNNAQFFTTGYNLTKKVNIIIPVFDSINLENCLNSIFSLNLNDKIKVIISNSNTQITFLDNYNHDNVKVIKTKTNLGFSDTLKECIRYCDDDADMIILNPNAIITKGSLESMQNYAYSLKDCGLISSQQITKNSPIIKKHWNYVNIGYWIDETPFIFEDNIVQIPIFYDGEFLELKRAPFFCTYLKREVFEKSQDFNLKFEDCETTMVELSDFIRLKMGLKIYTISDAKVLQNSTSNK